MEIEGSSYQQRVLDQLAKWEAGNSVHNQIDDECCPDFSCCHPKLQADKEQRQLYASSWRANRRDVTDTLLIGFLTTGLAQMNVDVDKIVIVGGNIVDPSLN